MKKLLIVALVALGAGMASAQITNVPGNSFTAVNSNSYTTAGVPAYVAVPSTFTTSGVGTALEAITGLTWTLPANTALNIPFSCHLVYHQNTANANVSFGFQNTVAATNMAFKTVMYTASNAFKTGALLGSTATTATSIVTGTPTATATDFNFDIDGYIEQPSGSASTFTINVSTATAADTVTVARGSFCRIG